MPCSCGCRKNGRKKCLKRKKCRKLPPREDFSCEQSRLRTPGIKPTGNPHEYFADADLVCVAFDCRGRDDRIVYEWAINPVNPRNPGGLRIIGGPRKIGNDRVFVQGTGSFDLSVLVTFPCECRLGTRECVRTATVRFTL